MAESIRFNDKYIDTTGVWDSTQGKTQQVMNDELTRHAISVTTETGCLAAIAAWAGKVVTVTAVLSFSSLAANTAYDMVKGLPKHTAGDVSASVACESGEGVCVAYITGGVLKARASKANGSYYVTLAYITTD